MTASVASYHRPFATLRGAAPGRRGEWEGPPPVVRSQSALRFQRIAAEDVLLPRGPRVLRSQERNATDAFSCDHARLCWNQLDPITAILLVPLQLSLARRRNRRTEGESYLSIIALGQSSG